MTRLNLGWLNHFGCLFGKDGTTTLLCEYAMLLLFLFLFCLNFRTDSTETRGYKYPVPSKYFWSGLEQRAETKTTSYMSVNLQAQIDAVAPITPSLTIYSHSLSANWRCFKPTNLCRSFNFLNNTAIITMSGGRRCNLKY
jgi:hypothetical protein